MPGEPNTDTRRADIEAIFPLLATQQALLLRRGLGGEADPGFLQVQCSLDGRLDTRRLREAWQAVSARHASMRMSCRSRSDGDPLLVVWKSAPAPFVELDWRESPHDAARLERFLTDDRRVGLDLALAPAHRVTIIRTSDTHSELVWTCHHIFIDGWSAARALDEVVETYGALERSEPLSAPDPDPYRAYHRFMSARSREASRDFWQHQLAGYTAASQIARRPGAQGNATATAPLDPATTDACVRAASSLKIAPSTLVQAAWALLVGRLLDDSDVVFGTTVSGRTAPIDGIETFVGNLSNLVPMRCRIPEDVTAADWLLHLRNEQYASQSFEHDFLSDIHSWSEVPGGRPLFETLLVIENFPVGSTPNAASIKLRDFRSDVTTTFPLTAAVVLDEGWSIRLDYDRSYFDPEQAAPLLTAFESALCSIARDAPSRSPAELAAELMIEPLAVVTPAASAVVADGDVSDARDSIEATVLRVWRRVLGTSAVGLSDDFFDLGGTSILAVRLFDEIERVLAVRLPLSTLLDTTTIEGIADLIRGGLPDHAGSLVSIQAGEVGPPLVCVHAGDLHVLFYRHLAKHLGADRQVLGLEPVGLDGNEDPLETIEDMAAAYVAELTAEVPEGPYHLLGHCHGGAVALEMTCQLEAAGHTVELLAVCDAGFAPPRVRTSLVQRAWRVLRNQGVGQTLALVRAKLVAQGAGAPARPASGGAELATQRVKQACRRAYFRYVPRPCAAPVTQIRSSDAVRDRGSAVEELWSQLTPHHELHVIDVSHESMFNDPEVAAVAAIIRPKLGTDTGAGRPTTRLAP